MSAALRRFGLPWLCFAWSLLSATMLAPCVRGAAVVTEPFAGVRYTHRVQTQPRLLSIHIVEIDLAHPGIRLLISPGNGATRGENTPRTVRAFVTAVGAQLGMNASFFLSSAQGANFDNRGVVASRGDVYSNFDGDNRPWPVLNISEDNFVQILSQAVQPSTTAAVTPAVPLYNAVSGSERIITNGRVTAGAVAYGEPQLLHPRSVAGITPDRRLVLLAVDGRQPGHSLGMYSREVAELLLQYGVVDAVNLDGGGSTTLVFADPTARVMNRVSDPAERAVGASLGVFAERAETPRDVAIYADFYAGDMGGFSAAPGAGEGGGQGVLASSSSAAIATVDAVARGWLQRLTVWDDPAVAAVTENAAGGWFVRHAWNPTAPGKVARPAKGWIGFCARTATPGMQAAIAVSAPATADRGVKRALIADGKWHLYEWNLEDATQWQAWGASDGRIAGGTFTLDSIQLFGPNADAVIDLDLVAHNALGRLAPELTPAHEGRLANLSVRATLTAHDPALMVGLSVLPGVEAKPMLVRAAGPALGALGVAAPLADPQVTVLAPNGAVVSANDNWGGAAGIAAAAVRLGAFPFAAGSRDAATLAVLERGNYNVQITGVGGATGVALVEAYDATETFVSGSSRLVNLSARTRTGVNGETLVGGFVVAGGTKRVLVRAVGPTLENFGVAGAVADPQLALYAGATLHAINDDWGGGPGLTEVFARVGAFALPAGSRDAALLVTLAPGAYSAHLRAADGGEGVVLLEVYEVP